MKEYRIAIVGATGLVGRKVINVIEERNIPVGYCKLFASQKSAGQILKVFDKEYVVEELKEDSFDEGFDFAIFSAGGDVSKKYVPIAVSKGCIVVDNSSAFRMDDEVPLVVPEVNPEDISWNKGIIANPNCSTIQAMLPLKVLDEKYGIKRVVYSTYQAVSGAGKKGIEDLNNKGGETLKKFPHPILNNCLPQIDVFMDNGYTKEEMKMINETRKILHKPELNVTATTVRVPVINSHSESINIELEKDFDINELRAELEKMENLIVVDNPELCMYPMAINASEHDEVFVGRIRRDYSVKYGINMWVVADNIRKGAATNAVQIVQKLINTFSTFRDSSKKC